MAITANDKHAHRALEILYGFLPSSDYILEPPNDRGERRLKKPYGKRQIILAWKTYRKDTLGTRVDLVPYLGQWFNFEPTNSNVEYKSTHYYFQKFENAADLIFLVEHDGKNIANAILTADAAGHI